MLLAILCFHVKLCYIYMESRKDNKTKRVPAYQKKKETNHKSICKLEIFIPASHLSALQKALQAVDAGHIGQYDSCMSYSPVTGCWRPLQGSTPYIGHMGEVSTEPEIKAEVTCQTEKVKETLRAIKEVHPYEEPVIHVIPLYMTGLDG